MPSSLTNSGDFLSFAEAAPIIPGRPHKSTIVRWSTRGYAGHVLETWRIAGKRFTTREAIERFLRKTMVATDPNPRTKNYRQQLADQKLKSHGVA